MKVKHDLPPCPFCGNRPMICCTYNKRIGIYGATVSCDLITCGASVHSNSRESREKARQDAIARWSRRTVPAPDQWTWTAEEILAREG